MEKKENDASKYKVVNGTSYNAETPDAVVTVLERVRLDRTRIRVFYSQNGVVWHDGDGMIGTVGRSTGSIKIPILIPDRTSTAGAGIIDDCIVRIDVKGYKDQIVTVYKKDGYTVPEYTVVKRTPTEGEDPTLKPYAWDVNSNTGLYARAKNEKAAHRLADYMSGKRWSK